MKLLTFLIPAVMITTAAFAQNTNSKAATQTPMQDGVMNKDGKMWYIKSLKDTMALDNGVTAKADGTVKLLGGKTITLHEGDCINFEGQMVGLNQKLTTVDGLVCRKNGVMWIWSVLKKPFALNNGTFAAPDATIKGTDGKYTKMKDNEFIDLDGNTSVMKKRGN